MPVLDLNDTEATPLGDGLCVFRRDNHALCILNGTAAEVWQARASGADNCAVAARLSKAYGIGLDRACADVEAIELGWQQSGLTAGPGPSTNGVGAKMQSLESCGDLPSPPPDPRQSLQTTTPYLDTVYDAARGKKSGNPTGNTASRNPAVRVKCHEPVLAGLLSAVLGPLETSRIPTGIAPEARLLEVGETGDGYWIIEDGVLTARDLERPQARRVVLQRVALAHHDAGSVSAILHASSVEIGGRALLIAGASGAGKTTLTAGLVRRGARYLADDLVPLSDDGECVGGFPVALAIKEGSWPVVGKMFPELASEGILETRSLRVRYLSLADPAAGQQGFRSAAGLVLPRYQPGASLSVRHLAPEEAFAALIDSGSAPHGTELSVRSMVSLVNKIPAWQLTYSDLDAAVARISELVAQ